MNCRKVSRKLSAYIEDDLSSSEKSKVDSHLKSCSVCRKRIADLRNLVEAAQQLERYEPGPYFVNRVMCAIGQKRSPRDILTSWKYRLSLSGVAFVVAASMTFFIIGPPAAVLVDTNSSGSDIETVNSLAADTAVIVSQPSEDGFPVPPEILERDMALKEKPIPDSLNTQPEIMIKRYVQPVNIQSDSNRAF